MIDLELPSSLPVTGCVAWNIKPYAWAYWVPTMIWESLLLALSLYKSARQAREEAGTPHLMVVILRDSILYFGGALATILANFIIWRAQVCIPYCIRSRRVSTSSDASPRLWHYSLLSFRQ